MNAWILSLTAGSGDGISVCFELYDGAHSERRSLIISTEALMRLGLNKGECSPELFDEVEKEARIYSAYTRGLYILSYGACSRNMLVSKLITKGEERSAVIEAVERICERGFINESESAKREAEIAVGKLWGESRIRAHLIQRKYPSEIVDEALFALEDEGLDFDVICKRAIASKYKKIPTDRMEMQKLIASMCRRGFSVSQIRPACIELAEEYRKKHMFD